MKAVLVQVDSDFKKEIDLFCVENGLTKRELFVRAVSEFMGK